jgi:hypothetical protein
MNNTNYPDMLCDFVPGIEHRRVTAMTLSFLNEASFEHTLEVWRGEHETGHYFRTVDAADGKTCLEALVLLEECNLLDKE